MCDQSKCTPSSKPLHPDEQLRRRIEASTKHATLKERQEFIQEIGEDLLDPNREARAHIEGLRRLLADLACRGVLWFDQTGHIADVEKRHGHEAALVELLLVLSFPDQWPPEVEGKKIPEWGVRQESPLWADEGSDRVRD